MTDLHRARLALAVGLTGAVLAPAGPASAADATVPEVTYTCVADSTLTSATTKVTFAPIGLPETITAGDTLSLTGTLGIAVARSQTVVSNFQGAKVINVESSTFNVDLSIGGLSANLVADETVGSPAKFAAPTTNLTATATFPAFVVPSGATGDLVITMPTLSSVDRTVPTAPEKVAFGTVLNQDALFAPERQLDCSAPKDATRVVVARIPITAAAETPTPEPTPDPTPDPTLAPLPTDPGPVEAPPLTAVPAPQTPILTESAPQLAPANAAIPPRTTGKGTFIPTWSLLLSGALVPAGFIYLAANQRRQLNQLMNAHRLQGEGTSE